MSNHSMTHPKQRAKGRAQQMFRSVESDDGFFVAGDRPYPNAYPEPLTLPLFVLFADEYDATVERMAKELCGEWPGGGDWNFHSRADFYRQIVRAQLASIGIAAPKGRARK